MSNLKTSYIEKVTEFNARMIRDGHPLNVFSHNEVERKHGFVLSLHYKEGGKMTHFFKTKKLAVQKLESIS